MNTMDLKKMGLQEMQSTEALNTDGGFLPLLLLGAVVLLGGCVTTKEAGTITNVPKDDTTKK